MRRVRFEDPTGAIRDGEWTDRGVEFGGAVYDPEEVNILPPVEPTKIVCLGSNYVEHIKEGGGDLPPRPLLFYKAPNAVAGHKDIVRLFDPAVNKDRLPADSELELGEGRIDFEAELGVVIGEQCRNVTAEDAKDVIAGYTCVNDISNRDDQSIETNWIRGKAFDGSAPIGPIVASPDLVDDDPRIRLWQNGELKQDSSNDEMVFSVSEAIEEITHYVTLERDDVISMGTTAGVGPMAEGDKIEIEIDGIGRLEHYVAGP